MGYLELNFSKEPLTSLEYMFNINLSSPQITWRIIVHFLKIFHNRFRKVHHNNQ